MSDFFGDLGGFISHPWAWSPDISPIPPSWRGAPSVDANGNLRVSTDTLLALPAVGLEERAAGAVVPSIGRLFGYGALGAAGLAYGYQAVTTGDPTLGFGGTLRHAEDAVNKVLDWAPYLALGAAGLAAFALLEG